jgi:hypothetical protein
MTAQFVSLFTPRDTHNYRVFTAWMTGAMLTFGTATILLSRELVPAIAGWMLTAATAVLMMLTMRSYILFLRQADELLRKVHLEALAFAFGAGIVSMMVWRLCERLGAPKLDVNDASLIMLVTWVAGQYIGARRYGIAEEQ